MDQVAFIGLAGDEDRPAGLGVEAEVGLALGPVGAVAGEAGVGEDGPNVPVELDGSLGAVGGGHKGQGQEEERGGSYFHGGCRWGRTEGGLADMIPQGRRREANNCRDCDVEGEGLMQTERTA